MAAARKFATIWILSPGDSDWHSLQTFDFEMEKRFNARLTTATLVEGVEERAADYRAHTEKGELRGSRVRVVYSAELAEDDAGPPPARKRGRGPRSKRGAGRGAARSGAAQKGKTQRP